MPTASTTLSAPRPDVVHLVEVDHLDAVAAGHLEALGHVVGGDDPISAQMPRDAGGHLPDRAETGHERGAAGGDIGPLRRLPRGGEHVGEEEVTLVGVAVRHLDRTEVRLRHPQVLGLGARHVAVELGVAEQGRALVVLLDLGGLALGVVPAAAHPAVPATDVERDDDPVTRCDVGDLAADLLDDAHRLVPEDVARVEVHAEHVVQVQVGAADGGRGHAYDRVGRVLDRGVRHGLHGHLRRTLPRQSSHAVTVPSPGQDNPRLTAPSAGIRSVEERHHSRR
jgi:hypothetical protein